MRGAGCTWNDITDRDFDAQVERTRSRPIPSGQVSVRQAVIWDGSAMPVWPWRFLLSFNQAAIAMGVLSLLPVAIYPFAKAVHMVAAGVSGAGLQLGRIAGLGCT